MATRSDVSCKGTSEELDDSLESLIEIASASIEPNKRQKRSESMGVDQPDSQVKENLSERQFSADDDLKRKVSIFGQGGLFF